ncbi:TIGR04255 family protein [Methylobacterium iners]|uniref:TIGR04255 family protein n=1 Tax=Methylobacterium iners TaxID=418707 RepID=A0ABQ4S1I8_9HYPH|nr:TIGR04255 family protein [Methylobacterium iners]GJD96981.1 hypothetical protein OCOJLMKI_4209 [Methylobacterium iners]
MTMKVQPLKGPPPAEVPLPRAPLVQVVAQVRFAPILAIGRPDKVVDFQEAIRSTYPNLTDERMPHFSVGANGVPSFAESVIWRFNGGSKSPKWRVSLGVDFVALETGAYVSRQDFLGRFELVLNSLQRVFAPGEIQRLGLRYVDRIVEDGLKNIHRLIKPNVLGISMPEEETSSSLYSAIQHLLTEAHLLAEEGLMQARWGHLSPNVTYDETALPALDKSSWVLDLDLFTTTPQPFESADLLQLTTRFAERNYSVFRDMVTEDFLRFYGGNL